VTQQHAIAGLGRHLGRLALAAAVAGAAACGAEGGREEYAQDADTGAAAPAVEGGGYDQSTADMIGSDSTLGTQRRTGTPGAAGDTMGQRGTPAGRPPAPPPPR
jgi:hypothetical protein